VLDPVRRALLVLAICSFGLGTGEYVALGLLPEVAGDLQVTIPQAGHLVSAYAAGVVIGAPLLTALSVRVPRKGLLIGLVLGLALGNIASALMPGFTALLVMRFLAGLPHGAFFGAASVQAAHLVPDNRRGQAMAIVFAGLTVSNVIGVPLTTYIGQHTSWRLVFALIAVVELIGVLGIRLTVPRAHPSEPTARLRNELVAFRNRPIWIALAVTTIGCGAIFSTFSYIAPMMTEVAGYGESSITWLLVVFGLGMTAGNLVGARLADRFEVTTVIYAVMAAQAVTAGVFYTVAHSRPASAVMIFLFPFAATMAFPAVQKQIIGLAGGAPNLAAAVMHAAFNIANSLGAWFGGLAIAAGLGYHSPNLVAAGLGLAAAVLALTAQLVRGPAPRSTPPTYPDLYIGEPQDIRFTHPELAGARLLGDEPAGVGLLDAEPVGAGLGANGPIRAGHRRANGRVGARTARPAGVDAYPVPVSVLRPAPTTSVATFLRSGAGHSGIDRPADNRLGDHRPHDNGTRDNGTGTGTGTGTGEGVAAARTGSITAPLLAALQQVTFRPATDEPAPARRVPDPGADRAPRPGRAGEQPTGRVPLTDRGTGRPGPTLRPEHDETGTAAAPDPGARPGSPDSDNTNPIPVAGEGARSAADTNPIPVVQSAASGSGAGPADLSAVGDDHRAEPSSASPFSPF